MKQKGDISKDLGLVKKVTQRMRVQNTYVFHYGKSVTVVDQKNEGKDG